MARLKLEFPCAAIFQTTIRVRITDLNYGAHLGNDALLSLMHDARVQFFNFLGASEINFFNTAVIMSDVQVQYKHEGFAGDELLFEMGINDLTERTFDVWYLVSKKVNDAKTIVAIAKTGMMCFDYTTKKVQTIPAELKEKMGVLNKN